MTEKKRTAFSSEGGSVVTLANDIEREDMLYIKLESSVDSRTINRGIKIDNLIGALAEIGIPVPDRGRIQEILNKMHDGLTREQIRETRRAIQRVIDGKPEPTPPPTTPGTVLLVTNSTYPPGRNQARVFRAGSKWIGEGGTYWEDSDLLEDYITWELDQ